MSKIEKFIKDDGNGNIVMSKKLLLPLGFVVIIVASAIYLVTADSSIRTDVAVNSEKISNVEEDISEIKEDINSIDQKQEEIKNLIINGGVK